MIFKLLTSMSLMMSMSFIYMNHPLSLGLIMIIQTTIVALILGLLSQNFWFSYILFLVIIGGMLIIFIYIISLIFNKIFMQNLNISPPLYFYMMFMMFMYYLISNNYKIYSLENFMNYKLTEEISMNIMKLYNFPMNMINLMMITYLFFLLIVVVKITNFFYGPLRMKI